MNNIVKMTSKERMKTALSGGIPDRVPVAPDFSCMIPCKLQNRPYWDVILYQNPPLWKAYLDACDYFHTDAWFAYGTYDLVLDTDMQTKEEISKGLNNTINQRLIHHTKYGDLTTTSAYYADNPQFITEQYIKDFLKDYKKLKELYSPIKSYKRDYYDNLYNALGDRGIMVVTTFAPGLHMLSHHFNGNMEAAVYAYYDHQDQMEELFDAMAKQQNQVVEICCNEKAESILTGGSGSITMQSPAIWDKYSLPVIKEQTRMCKQAGVISGIHSCGKEMHIVEKCANETDLNYINPLEIPPMGDSTIALAREKVGNKLSLMGNLHTSNVMLFGSTKLVRLESLKAIRDGAQNGGFVLSTGDQCGRDTPFENIFEMVKVVEEFGSYPLNMDKINSEIYRLEKELNV